MSHTTTTPFTGHAEMREAASRLILAAARDALAGLAFRIHAWYLERRRISRAIAELSALSDHMLKDIGVDRASIDRIARDGREVHGLRT